MGDSCKNDSNLKQLLFSIPKDIRRRSHLKTVKSGETIVKKGDEVKSVYILIEGDVKVTNEFPNGQRYTFAQILSISFIGELEILAGEKEFATNVEAVTSCRMLVLTAEDFTQWIKSDPVFLMAVTKILAKKMYLTSSENGTVIFFSGVRKLQNYIVNYCRERMDREVVLINRNRQQIAEEIGTSVKTVNRCVEKLKAGGFLMLKRGKIYINKDQYTNMLQIIEK